MQLILNISKKNISLLTRFSNFTTQEAQNITKGIPVEHSNIFTLLTDCWGRS